MLGRMNIRSLEQFLALATHLHFGRASVESNISLSALSRNIRQLEEDTGVVLFMRDNRRVALTPEGRKFEQYARAACRDWQDICQELTDVSGGLTGEIRLYCSVTASQSILFDLFNQFRARHPGIEIKLHTGDPEHAVERVANGDDDIAVAALPSRLHRGVQFLKITESPLVFIAPTVGNAEFQLPHSAQTTPNSIWEQVPMILSERGLSRERVDQWFRKQGVTPRIYAQVSGNEAIVSMVSLGLGVGVVPQIVLTNSMVKHRIQVLDLKPALKPYEIGLFRLKRHAGNRLVDAFWHLAG